MGSRSHQYRLSINIFVVGVSPAALSKNLAIVGNFTVLDALALPEVQFSILEAEISEHGITFEAIVEGVVASLCHSSAPLLMKTSYAIYAYYAILA